VRLVTEGLHVNLSLSVPTLVASSRGTVPPALDADKSKGPL
jgi:hypothetical protein